MFRDLVSPRSSAAAVLEAITAERDFFKEKYAAHASEMEALKTQLKESQRMVDKLRNQVLDLGQQVMELEGGKSSRSDSAGGEQGQVGAASNNRPSLAEINNNCGGKEPSTDNETDSHQPRRNISNVVGELSTSSANTKKQSVKEDENSEKENNDENEEEEEEGESEGLSDDEDDDDDSHDNDEAEAIRLKASRMLAWASYQSTRRTPSTPMVDDKGDGEFVMETPDQPTTNRSSAAYTLPTKIQSLLDNDEDSGAVASESKLTTKRGKMGKFVNNVLKDMIGTQSESDSSYVDDNESSSSDENLSDNLARMKLDVQYDDGQDEL